MRINAVLGLMVAFTTAAGTLTAYAGETDGEPKMTEEMVARSVLSEGNAARLRRVMHRAGRGERIVVGAIGGSITSGGAASSPSKRYASLIGEWWLQTFPESQIELVNAGAGGTGSSFGCFRVGIDLLAKNPDFVVVEFGVNDGNTEDAAKTLEGVVRQILKQPNGPAVILLFMMSEPDKGRNAQEWHGKIGRHYELPMISFRDVMWPEIEAGRMAWEDVIADKVHPNDLGHWHAAELITRYLESIHGDLDAADSRGSLSPLPKPLLTDEFEFTTMMNAGSILPAKEGALELKTSEGWTVLEDSRHGPAWISETQGSELEFEFEGSSAYVTFHRRKQSIGVAEAQVDDLPSVKLEGLIHADFSNNSHTTLVAAGLGPGPHRLRIRLLDELQPDSDGHYFEVRMIMAAGAPALAGSLKE